MSLTLGQLKALRRQAGAPTTPARSAATDTACKEAKETGSHAAPPATLPATAGGPRAGRSVFDWIEREPPPVRSMAAGRTTVPAASDIAATMPASHGQPRDVAALRRLLATRERLPATPGHVAARACHPASPADRHLPGTEISPGLWLNEVFLPQPIPSAPLPLAFAKRPNESVDPRELLFFDTETTGLAGGTGTRAFMVGAADWHVDGTGREGLRVRQLTMATLGAEPAMLGEFASWLGPRTVLSSYNGRCYDAPLLKTRYRLARLPDPLAALDHVDLLFPTRRHWRGRWENCRLATIERNLLGIVREDDLPGSQAPAAWLTFLRGGDASELRRVGAHNHQDVVTLARLFLRLVEAGAD